MPALVDSGEGSGFAVNRGDPPGSGTSGAPWSGGVAAHALSSSTASNTPVGQGKHLLLMIWISL
ncbi:MAG: hypothetical protein F9K25_19850 [Candidatus Contendobacter sp.]|nr:MAG: hypothetical protein F9K25_19850 [Candidatus Contendobacter sp.]